jgi:hypothetical protein
MRFGIELAGDNCHEAFIGLSSGTCDGVKVRSPPLYLVDSEIHLCSRECILPIMLSKVLDDLDPWHSVIGEELDDISLLTFHDLTRFVQ